MPPGRGSPQAGYRRRSWPWLRRSGSWRRRRGRRAGGRIRGRRRGRLPRACAPRPRRPEPCRAGGVSGAAPSVSAEWAPSGGAAAAPRGDLRSRTAAPTALRARPRRRGSSTPEGFARSGGGAGRRCGPTTSTSAACPACTSSRRRGGLSAAFARRTPSRASGEQRAKTPLQTHQGPRGAPPGAGSFVARDVSPATSGSSRSGCWAAASCLTRATSAASARPWRAADAAGRARLRSP